jgi:hypothetical protein
MQREASGLHPFWRFRHSLNQQKVAFGDGANKKMLINHERSWNVYENNRINDTVPEKNTDIFARMKPVLQKIAAFGRQFTAKREESAALFSPLASDF